MTTLRSAFPDRMSYNVKVRSVPMLAKTDVSLRLKRTLVTSSVDVGRVRFDIGALLREGVGYQKIGSGYFPHFVSSQTCKRFEAVTKSGSERWWSIELRVVLEARDDARFEKPYLKPDFPGNTFTGCDALTDQHRTIDWVMILTLEELSSSLGVVSHSLMLRSTPQLSSRSLVAKHRPETLPLCALARCSSRVLSEMLWIIMAMSQYR